MSFIEELQEKSRNIEAIKTEVIDEILNYFRIKFSEGWLEDYLRKHISKDIALRRQYGIGIRFWKYTSGCSDTNFSCGSLEWTNPSGSGYKSWNYKGIKLNDIHQEVCKALTDVLVSELRYLGFTISDIIDRTNRFGKYHKSIIITW